MPVLELSDRASDMVIKICGNGTIGRKGDTERGFFAQCRYVSEYHCDILFENGSYYVEHLHTALNPTVLNQVVLKAGVPLIIRDRDSLKIADKLFKVAIRYDEVCPDAEAADIAAPVGRDALGAPSAAEPAAAAAPVGHDALGAPPAMQPPVLRTTPFQGRGLDTAPSGAAAPQYIVECPKCGAVYDVPGPDERVRECLECDDYDKYEISKSGARAK